jgi:hypothetical protein
VCFGVDPVALLDVHEVMPPGSSGASLTDTAPVMAGRRPRAPGQADNRHDHRPCEVLIKYEGQLPEIHPERAPETETRNGVERSSRPIVRRPVPWARKGVDRLVALPGPRDQPRSNWRAVLSLRPSRVHSGILDVCFVSFGLAVLRSGLLRLDAVLGGGLGQAMCPSRRRRTSALEDRSPPGGRRSPCPQDDARTGSAPATTPYHTLDQLRATRS